LRLVAGGWFVLREKYCWLVADKPSEQADTTKVLTQTVHMVLRTRKISTKSLHVPQSFRYNNTTSMVPLTRPLCQKQRPVGAGNTSYTAYIFFFFCELAM
jgi:hypothetical protein